MAGKTQQNDIPDDPDDDTEFQSIQKMLKLNLNKLTK